jgi:hypothetical protein
MMTSSKSDYPCARRAYTAPQLTTYGLFRELTASGSNGTLENNQGGGQPTRRA